MVPRPSVAKPVLKHQNRVVNSPSLLYARNSKFRIICSLISVTRVSKPLSLDQIDSRPLKFSEETQPFALIPAEVILRILASSVSLSAPSVNTVNTGQRAERHL
jgi:hypothetical protein